MVGVGGTGVAVGAPGSRVSVGVGVRVGVGDGVSVGVSVGVGVWVSVGVGVGVKVEVAVGVGVKVEVDVGVGGFTAKDTSSTLLNRIGLSIIQAITKAISTSAIMPNFKMGKVFGSRVDPQ